MTRRSGWVLPMAVALIAAACSVSDTLPPPNCESSPTSALISGQSVPTASFLICLDTLPTGWEVDEVRIGDEGTVVVFDSDRAGASAARLRFEESCDIGEATPTPTEFEGTSRYEWILGLSPGFRANRYYRFVGGCVTWEFDFDDEAPAAMSVELGNALQLVDRRTINDQLRETFVDEDL